MESNLYAALPSVPITLVICDENLELAPLKIGEIPAFARAVQPVVAHISGLPGSPDWLALLAEHGEAVIEAVAIASRRPNKWVTRLEIDDAVRLAEAVFEVNTDFFIRRVLPSMTEAAARIGTLMPGLTQSRD